MSAPPNGYRGYISSRPIRGTSYPQRVQNLVVRNYAIRRTLPFKLSLTEYAMPGCFMMLQTLLDDLPNVDGVIFFSMFMLPPARQARARIYQRLLAHGVTLHAALEDSVVSAAADIGRFEDTIDVAKALGQSPLRGRYAKDVEPFAPGDPFVRCLRRTLELS